MNFTFNFSKLLQHIFGVWGVYIVISGTAKIIFLSMLVLQGQGTGKILLQLGLEVFFVALAFPFMILPSLRNLRAINESDTNNSSDR